MAADRVEPGSTPVVESLKKAHAAAPVRDDYTVMLARALARAGSFEAARMVLGPVVAHPSLPESRGLAIAAINDIVAAETAATRMDPTELPPPERQDSDASPPPSREQTVYRTVGAGEQRVEGLLERMDCSAKRIEFVVKLPDRVARFQAASLGAIEFISYRTDLQGSVACGPRKPADHVYVTLRPGNLDGTVVAIEFLPM
jgi:hypothetical protein